MTGDCNSLTFRFAKLGRLQGSNLVSRPPAEVYPGIFLIDLPLPSMLGRVNVFLIRSGDGFVLFDTGMNYDPCRAALENSLATLGIPWHAIHTIFLSHFHPDHVGLAAFVAKQSKADVRMHQSDYDHLLEYSNKDNLPPWTALCLDKAGSPPELRLQMDSEASQLFQSGSPTPIVRFIDQGEAIPSILGPLDVIWTPGHSAGHLCLYSRTHQLLLSGDHILDGITPNIHYHPNSDPLGDFLSSLDKTAALPVRHILPCHGVPFVDHVSWIERVKNHHKVRCERIIAALSQQPLSCYGLSQQLWKRPLSPFHLRFALFELLAHLEFLRIRGTVHCDDHDGINVWR